MDLGLTRRNVGRLVLLAWAVALAWLARREFSGGESAATAERTGRLAPAAHYFAVLAGDRQIGQLNISVDTLVDGVRLTELLVLDLPEQDSTHQLARSTEYSLTRSLRLRRFTRTIFGEGLAERLDAELGPDSILTLRDREGSGGSALAVGRSRVPPDLATLAVLPYRVAFGGALRVGGRTTVPVLDLGRGDARSVEVRVTAESTFAVPDSAVFDPAAGHWVPATLDSVRAWRLEHDGPGAPSVSWVDAGGGLVRQEVAGGVTLVRSAFELVRNNYRADRQREPSAWRRAIPGMLSLAASGRVPDTTVAVRRILVRADRAAPAGSFAAGLAGGRQRVDGDTVTITRAPGPDSATARPGEAATGPGWETPVLDERMAGAARGAVAGARTARDSLAALTRWVARQIATDEGPGGPSTASIALRSGRATPDGKARLLATLARAAGIPARVVTGVALLPDAAYAHAWTELWLAGAGWAAADPTFGHFPASTALLRVASGDRSRPVVLVPRVASARFLPLGNP